MENEVKNKRTCLYDRHVALGALISPFGGFDMPIQYTDIISEHNAVRHGCGVFDVSHMGEVRVTGKDAERYVQHIFTNDVSQEYVGKIQYGLMLYPSGGTVDDLLVYKMGENDFFLVINAANIDKDVEWMNANSEGFDVDIDNQSAVYGQIAVQGPGSESVVEEVLGLQVRELEFYTFKTIAAAGETLIVSRTGYTGEDGFEIYGSPAYIMGAWDALVGSGKAKPCGLGARDTLRFEVGLPLYGDELGADISPIQAGLGIFVKTGKPEFIGREAILQQKEQGVPSKIVGLELDDRAIPRHGYEVVSGDKVVGHVTTGYNSISTGKSVAMALVDSDYAALGTKLQVKIHRKLHTATVTKKKFYNKNYKK
jgi:aminomethyltransferase